MTRDHFLDELWESTPPGERALAPGQLVGLPDPARRYLEHAIGPGAQLASAVRLRMHGEIKLKRWFPFSAEQVIRWDGGMIWRATACMHGMPIRGFDRLVDGKGEMRWKLFGIIPLITAAGPDITRSATGRVAAESVWLPSVLCNNDVSWTAPDSAHARASFTVLGERVQLAFTVDDKGRPESVMLKRWGNHKGGEFHCLDFGGFVEDEGTFGGYTIPTRLRVGWHFGSERLESEGEFFRVTIDDARYR
ncbi:MAG: DUF6544 family protein [Candidatus Entotheonellia bacterium]